MRNDSYDPVSGPGAGEDAEACDEKEFFESFYGVSVRGEPDDLATIASVTEPESRFHYNAVENALIRALLRRSPPPRGPGIATWRMFEQRAQRRLLDVGSGTGHWVDFFRDVFFVKEVVAVEVTERMSAWLTRKYAGDADVTVLAADVADPAFDANVVGGAVDWVSAIGVMFHIVDDDRWRAAVHNLANVTKPGGLLFMGGDFGAETRDVQFHRRDTFRSWKEAFAADDDGAVRVNKRVRSLAEWVDVVGRAGLEVVDLVRADLDPRIATPENDVLVLRKPDAE